MNHGMVIHLFFRNMKDKLIGLGACDMKGGLAAILSTVSKLDLNKNKLALYFTSDEEISVCWNKKY